MNWSTATEINNLGFSIERKSTNSDWSEIGFVGGRGNTTEKSYYSFIDNSISTNKYSYRLKQIDYNGSYEYSNTIEVVVNQVNEYSLKQNYPNPFNPSTTIDFSIAERGLVNLSVYNLLGEKIVTLVDEVLTGGNHEIQFNAYEFSSGIYLVKMSSEKFSKVIKINFLK